MPRIPENYEIGAKASFRRTLTEADMALFIGVTWDINPYHTDDTFAAETPFGKRIVPGLLTASLLTHLGGIWSFLATKMELEFLAPVYAGETVTAEAEIADVKPEKGWVLLKCRCTTQDGREVLRGAISGYPAGMEKAG